MHISIATLFPALYQPFINTSIIERAVKEGIISFSIQDLFAFSKPKERIDSPSFGPGAGMLLKPEIIEKAIESQEHAHGKAYKIFFSPHGQKLDQQLLKQLASTLQEKKHFLCLPARYEGMDARVEEHYADIIISIGDYVLMGGDLPTMVLIEGLLRLLPGVIGKQESVLQDSFTGPFVDYPEFTAPIEWKGHTVPEVIRSGHHEKISQWRKQQAAQRSVLNHFSWVRSHVSDKKDRALAAQQIPSHYVVLMHDHILLENEREGTSSVTSLDIHDIARSASTYGIKKYFIVTPLKDQQKIVNKLLSFWRADVGIAYNPQRHEALKLVHLVSDFQEVLEIIKQDEQTNPILIATSASELHDEKSLTYYEQAKVWQQAKPVVLVLGTARGLAPSFIKKCDYLLKPIIGFTDFNHLSVRSAAAVIFDRWFGVNLE